jgi:hypothetical protein|uniref:Uncharacterized protein n=1 Tax=Cyanidiaceae sp. MX-AZ01 TaxID=1503164 RepID=A0A060AEN3_9RHOD|nr:hypothetical protein [Cyanidiaceae sp. MX-AZ01]
MDLTWITWLIHYSSVIEWIFILYLIPTTYHLAMYLNLISAWAAISWHLTHNQISWLIFIQAVCTAFANYFWYEHSKRTHSWLKKIQ